MLVILQNSIVREVKFLFFIFISYKRLLCCRDSYLSSSKSNTFMILKPTGSCNIYKCFNREN